jgi:hypothetical protein
VTVTSPPSEAATVAVLPMNCADTLFSIEIVSKRVETRLDWAAGESDNLAIETGYECRVDTG